MKLTVVGCSGSIPSAESAASCYLVEHEDFRLVLDLGHGALGALQEHIAVEDIDAVAISHLHADHWVDLTGLYVARRYGRYELPGRLPIYGPAATADRFADTYGFSRNPGLHSYFDFAELSMTTEIGPFRVQTAVTAHPTPTTAVRLSAGGASLTYTADTGPCQAVVELAEESDLLVAEATFVDGEDNPTGLHLTGKQAGELASAAAVSQLLITHIPPWNSKAAALAEASSAFAGVCAVARPGWSLDMGR